MLRRMAILVPLVGGVENVTCPPDWLPSPDTLKPEDTVLPLTVTRKSLA
ncbi:hypothetical protein NT945_002120 [Salmonella enterica]|nr:hypothetical protein [Salmonella enterica]